MPAREDITYFGAGPALLPTETLERAAQALVNFNGTGLGLAEHSHRSEIANTIINEAKADLARTNNNGNFGIIPDESTWKLSKNAALVYYCDNETVDGVEFAGFPKILAPGPDGKGPIVVADMSSNILSRKVDVKNFSVIFFGAQKNLGSTGITVVIIKKSLIAPITKQPSAQTMRQLGLPIPPIILQYDTIAQNNSLYNTLSIFDVYIAGQVLKRALANFPDNVSGQEKLANQKAELIYNALDSHPDAYRVVPDKSVRSRMNICFRVTKGGDIDAAEKDFLKKSTALGLTGLKGHRSVGGIRASNYNSITLEGAQKLAQFLVDFAKAS
ncbi:Phosphoserine aminotransferase [Trichoderma lentiforme]|uniref:phosphoserine transaminase n=1 Tax=Trichoderma lentiforme TaxID=1567552 RepID=A0A9P4XSB5_9HYPO|nr:Phosphoserine aminotransferase [Trichoderma lentiforme]